MSRVINKTPIVGYVRYSQKINFGEEKDMFAPEYFEYRFNIFKNITLRSFQNQTNKDFILLLFHSENMPSQYKEKFTDLENANTFLYNIYLKDTDEDFQKALLASVEFISFDKDVAVTFRVDNDDALQNNFIETLNGFLKKDFAGCAINMPTNHIIKHITKDSYLVENRYYPSNSIGLANVTTEENFTPVFNLGQHHLTNDENPLILLAKNKGGGLMTINGENAINSIDKHRSSVLSKEELKKYLENNGFEDFNLNCLRIFNDRDKFSSKKWLNLMVPPVFHLIIGKVKKIINS